MRLVPVTRDHIANGVDGSPCACPVALALNDAGYHPCDVQPDGINFGSDEKPDARATSYGLFSWMDNFDFGRVAEPFTIVIAYRVTTLDEYQKALRRAPGPDPDRLLAFSRPPELMPADPQDGVILSGWQTP